MKIIYAFLMVIMCLAWSGSNAQISLKGIKDKASNAMEDALERKIESEMNKAAQRAVDKYWERILGKYYSGLYADPGTTGDASGSSSSRSAAFPFMMVENVEINEDYSFNHAVRIQVDTYKKNGKLDETVFIVNHSNHEESYIGTSIEDKKNKQSEDMFIINDFANKALIMLMNSDGEKMRLAYSLQADEEAIQEMEEAYEELPSSEKEPELMEFTTIGTKDILGHPCKGYRQENEETISEVWLAHEDVFGMENMFGAKGMNNAEYNEEMIAAGYPQGSIMEWTSIDKDSKEKTTLTVVEISDNIEVKYDMSEYPSAAELKANEGEE